MAWCLLSLRRPGSGAIRPVARAFVPRQQLSTRPSLPGEATRCGVTALRRNGQFVRRIGDASREPVGQGVAGLLGAGGLDSVRPFLVRTAIAFFGVSAIVSGLSHIGMRKRRASRVWYKLALAKYQTGQKGFAATLLYHETMRLSRGLLLKSYQGKYDEIEEEIKIVTMAVTCLLEVENHQHAKRLLDLWSGCMEKVVQLDEEDRLRVIMASCYGDMYACAGSTKESYEHYGKALVNSQKLVNREASNENEALLGSILEKSGRLEMHNRNFPAARVFFEQALVQAHKVLPEKDRQFIGLLNSLAAACDNCSLYDDGIRAARQGLEISATRNHGNTDLQQVSALHYNLATLYLHKGDVVQSRAEAERALAMARRCVDESQARWCRELLAEIGEQEKGTGSEQEAAQVNKTAWW